jgi:hypothetical protein
MSRLDSDYVIESAYRRIREVAWKMTLRSKAAGRRSEWRAVPHPIECSLHCFLLGLTVNLARGRYSSFLVVNSEADLAFYSKRQCYL